jgi:glycosyltransferase involved in cell wall biosynthesis
MKSPPASPLDPAARRYGYAPADPAAPPAVSVVTPFFNTPAALFAETTQSVLRQSLQQWEWVVVNDGSDDAEALRALAALRASGDPRVRVIDQPNRGLSAARNAGAAAARAPLLFFLDSDDLIAPTTLEKLAWSLVGRPASAFAGAWANVFGWETWRWNLGFDTRLRFPTVNTLTANAMARAAAFAALGGFDEGRRSGLEDYELWVRAAAGGLWGHDVPEYLVWVRRKTPEQYRGYGWEFQRRRTYFEQVRAELAARHPQVFRDGPPALPGPGPLDTHVVLRTALPWPNRLRPGPGRAVLLLLPAVRTGGADRFALDLAAGLAAAGDRVTVVLTRGDLASTWLDELLRITPDVFSLPAFLAPADVPRFLHYLVESRGITAALISNSLLAYRLLPYLRSRCPGLAVVDYQHNLQPQRDGGFPRVGVEHTALVDLHVASSAFLRDWMVAEGVDPARAAVCTTNVDVAYWSPDAPTRARVRAELGLADGTPLILFVGRLTAQKRPELLVEILRRLRERGAPFAALLAGGGEDEGWVRSALRRHGLAGQVRALGDQPQARVRELMRAADLLLLPSAYEGIALTLFEAMAAGVVPVASDVGGQRELVTPACGVLVPLGGPDEAAPYVAALAALIADPARRAALAGAGRERVRAAFNAEQLVGRMRSLLDRAAALAAEQPRPAVDPGVGLAAATLAMEYEQLDARLRALPPVRLLLALRYSAARRLLGPLAGARRLAFRTARRLYALQRAVRSRTARPRGPR